VNAFWHPIKVKHVQAPILSENVLMSDHYSSTTLEINTAVKLILDKQPGKCLISSMQLMLR